MDSDQAHPKRRQFRLRDLLISTAIICVALSIPTALALLAFPFATLALLTAKFSNPNCSEYWIIAWAACLFRMFMLQPHEF